MATEVKMIWMAMAMADPGAFAGTWVLSDATAGRAKVAEVVEEGAARFNFAIRPIARSKIRKACAVDTSIAISGASGKIVMTYKGDNPRTGGGPSDGTRVSVLGSMAGYKVAGTTLTVDGSNDDGGKLSVYTVDGDSMSVKHSVTGSSLGPPALSWTLSYKRQ